MTLPNTMTTATSRNSLSSERRALGDLMRKTWYGRILNLEIKDGEPVLQPRPRVIRERKFGAQDDGALAAPSDDFLLKKRVRELFEEMDRLQHGVILRLEIKEGLPWQMEWDSTVEAA